MAGQRTDKSTISGGRDPLDGVNFNQPPIDQVIPKPTNPTSPETQSGTQSSEAQGTPVNTANGSDTDSVKDKVTVVASKELLERLRNVAYWEHMTLAALVEDGIRHVIDRYERRNNGPYELRPKPLTPGRPAGSRNRPSKGRK
jgi:hypothetical protein